jgi:hypothetical protein
MLRSVPLAFAAILFAAAAFAQPEQWRQFGWERTDFDKTDVDFAEIIMGFRVLPGMSTKDRIPAIDDPTFVAVGEAEGHAPTEPVVTVVIEGDARAYPLAVLTWHEIVNDTVGGLPVLVTYCPLCNTALVFERTVGGRVLDFGTSGLLRNSDLIMYDRQTDSWWQQFTGGAIVGEMTGMVLAGVPARLESFGRFVAAHPEGQVLVPGNPALREYGRNPYVNYDSLSRPFLYRGAMPPGIEPMARVVMVETDGAPKAIALSRLRQLGTVEIGDVVLTWEPGQNSAVDETYIRFGRDVGNVVAQRRTAEGLKDIVYHVTFAFAFHAFHPDIPIRQD